MHSPERQKSTALRSQEWVASVEKGSTKQGMTRQPTECATRQCVRGFLSDGYVKNDQGVCVRPKDCSKHLDATAKKGLYKKKDGKCVKPSQCDTPTKQPETCPKNEVYSTCVNPCNDCQIRGKCQFLVCNKGCNCKKGYHRDGSGKCIPASQCPGKNECGKNEEYKTCGTACQVTCSNRFLKVLCIDKCVEGCFCKEGYIRNEEGKCIEPSQCPI
ncbi:hypothetical protein JTE90_024509, partial [Oedothorax gibbosus]